MHIIRIYPLLWTISREPAHVKESYAWGQIRYCTIWAASSQNQQNGMCAQRRLRSAWASEKSDQSLRCALNGKLKTQAFFMRTAKSLITLANAQADLSLRWAHSHFVGFETRRLNFTFRFASIKLNSIKLDKLRVKDVTKRRIFALFFIVSKSIFFLFSSQNIIKHILVKTTSRLGRKNYEHVGPLQYLWIGTSLD